MRDATDPKPIKIVLGNQSGLLQDIVRGAVKRQTDMEIVGEVAGRMDLLIAVGETKADVVVLWLDGDEEPGVYSHLLAEYPHLTILGIAQRDGWAFIEQLCPRRLEFGAPAEEDLLSELRSAVRIPCRVRSSLRENRDA